MVSIMLFLALPLHVLRNWCQITMLGTFGKIKVTCSFTSCTNMFLGEFGEKSWGSEERGKKVGG